MTLQSVCAASFLALALLLGGGCASSELPRVDPPTEAPQDDDDDSTEPEACVPQTCEDVGAACGVHDDGCDGEIGCGACGGGSDCVPIEDGWECGCAIVEAGGSLTLDVPSVRVVFSVRLDGDVPDPAWSTESDHAGLMLRPTEGQRGVGWERVAPGTWDDEAGLARSEVPFRVIPGRYDLYYGRTGADPDSPWPRNRRALVLPGLDLTEAQQIEVDLRPIDAQIELTLAGAPLDESPLLPGEVISFELKRDTTGEKQGNQGGASLPDFVELGTISAAGGLPEAVRVLPGAYRLHYSNLQAVSPDGPAAAGVIWPLAFDVSTLPVVLSPITTTIAGDLPFSEVTFDLRLNGQPAGPDTLQPGDGPRLKLGSTASPGPGPPIPPIWLPPFLDESSGALRLPMTVRVMGADARVIYGNDWDPAAGEGSGSPRWPWNPADLGVLAINDGASFTASVEAAEVSIQVTLAGEDLSGANTSAQDQGELQLIANGAPGASTSWTLPPLWDAAAGAPTTPQTLRIHPGDYRWSYRSDADGMGSWPAASSPVGIGTPMPIAGGTSLLVDVPVSLVDVQWAVSPSTPPLQDEDGAPRLEFCWTEATGMSPGGEGWIPPRAFVVPLTAGAHELRVPPAAYNVIYRPGSADTAGSWPSASFKVWQSVDLTESTAIEVQLRSTEVTLQLGLDGQPADEATSGPLDHGQASLTRQEPRGTYAFLSSWSSEKKATKQQTVRLPTGEYVVNYYPGSAVTPGSFGQGPSDGVWPLSPGAEVGCVRVP